MHDFQTLPWDSHAVITTAICGAILLLLIFFLCRSKTWVGRGFALFTILVFLAPLFLSLFPTGVSQSGDDINVHFLLRKKKTYSLRDYTLEPVQAPALKGCSRIAASNGLLGYWGKWKTPEGKTVTSYLTHRTDRVFQLTPKADPTQPTVLLNIPWD